MRKWITGILSVLLMFLIQTSVFRFLPLGVTVPNFLLLLCCIYGLFRGEIDGLITGFFCGLLLDVFYLRGLGFYALIYGLIGYLNGLANPYFNPRERKLPLILIPFSDLAYLLLMYLLFYVLNGRFDFMFYLTDVLLPELLMTFGGSILIYPLFLLIENRFVQRGNEDAG